jgi:hypothetical protein
MLASEAVDLIKRLKGTASLKVTLQDGTERPVAMPKAGNRWSRVIQILDSLLWVSIECLDKDGRLVGPAIEDADGLSEDPDEEAPGNAQLARVLMDVMRTTMKETRLMFDAQLRGQAELMSTMTEGMRQVSDAYRQALQVQAANLMAPPSADGERGPEMMQMLQMAMALMNRPPAPQIPPKKEG